MAVHFLVGTAGWSIPLELGARFPPGKSALERYSRVFPAVEINSSFWRRHRASTWVRWAETVPPGFRFSVKVPRTITHDHKLVGTRGLVEDFFEDIGGLGAKLGAVLVQLPPSLAFDARRARTFFTLLREHHGGDLACEPRHASWLTPRANALLASLAVARAVADPPPAPAFDAPGGHRAVAYYRLHGSPRTYYSAYGEERLRPLAATMVPGPTPAPPADPAQAERTWCFFDNTASGAAAGDALFLQSLLGPRTPPAGAAS